MTTIKRWKARLPAEVADKLILLRSQKDTELFSSYATALRDTGWSLASIGEPVGLTRERIRQLCVATPADIQDMLDMFGWPVPEKALKPVRVRVVRVVIEPEESTLARLLELQPYAQQVRGNSPRFRAESEEYTYLLNHEKNNRGVMLSTLAKRLGLSNGAVRFRLVRYGYQTTTGLGSMYQPIKWKNRVRV
jgi:hypothetical protein